VRRHFVEETIPALWNKSIREHQTPDTIGNFLCQAGDDRAGVGMADQHDVAEIPLHQLVHQVVDLLCMVHPFLYTFSMTEDRRCESLMARLVQVSDDRGPVRARMPRAVDQDKIQHQ
jgi:hypothetical protein